MTTASSPALPSATLLSRPHTDRPIPSRHPLAPLCSAGTVRLRCAQVLQSVEQNLSASFKLDRAALVLLSRRVIEQLAAAVPAHADTAPGLRHPFWQALQAGGVDRLAELEQLLSGQPADEQARAWTDLAVLGVLLGADPGPRWRYTEQQGLPTAAFAQAAPDELLALQDRAGKTALPAAPPADDNSGPAQTTAAAATTFGDGEGLAIASFRAFVAGAFSADKNQPCRVQTATLRHVDVAARRAVLQGTPQNPIQGLEGRAAVLARFGQLLQALPGAGGAAARPCDWVQSLATPGRAGTAVDAASLLSSLLRAGAALWPNAPVQGLPAGDVWQHRWAGEAVAATVAAAGADLGTSGWVPLHATGQALVGALALPLQRAGLQLCGLETLTASAGHATSALLLAAGVIVPRQQRLLSRGLALADEAVVECRALAVALFDELTSLARAGLHAHWGADAARLTVAEVVQATADVWAGGGAPALRIEGDGALF